MLTYAIFTNYTHTRTRIHVSLIDAIHVWQISQTWEYCYEFIFMYG